LEKLSKKCKILHKNERKTAAFFENLIEVSENNQEKLSKIPVITSKIYLELVPVNTGMDVCHTGNYWYLSGPPRFLCASVLYFRIKPGISNGEVNHVLRKRYH
jgi:hypothetical protein